MKDDKKKKQKKQTEDGTLLANSLERVNRYGQADNEFVKAYTGYEWHNERTGQSGFAKGHKQVAQSKVNPQYERQNIKQQAGFNAEIDVVASKNAENIKHGSFQRVARSNDVGRGNDTQVDIGSVGANGDFIIMENGNVKDGVQLKFSGKYSTPEDIQQSAKTNVNRMRPQGRWGRYGDIAVPSEQYEPMRQYAQTEAAKAKQRAAVYRKRGNIDEARKCEQKAREYENCYRRIKNSGITSKEAVFAREHPLLHTAKRIGETSHEAGMEQLPSSVAISGAISAAQNFVAIQRGEKTYAEAAKDIVIDSATGAAKGYLTTSSGAALKGIMLSSSDKIVKAVAKTNAPAMIVQGVTGAANSFRKYLRGDLNGLELMEDLGANGVGIAASTWGAGLGSLVFPGVGTLVGGLVGSVAASVIYNGAMKTLHDERLSVKQRREMESWAREATKEMRHQRQIVEEECQKHRQLRLQAINGGLHLLEDSEINGDVNTYIEGMQKIMGAIGMKLPFENQEDVNTFMRDSTKKLIF